MTRTTPIHVCGLSVGQTLILRNRQGAEYTVRLAPGESYIVDGSTTLVWLS